MKRNMHDNFNLLEERVLDALDKTDLEKISYHLKKISTPTITTGVGGSSVVSIFASKVLSTKNKIIVEHAEPRDFIYKNLSGYDNVLACSCGGKNYGVKTSFNNNLNKYLLSRNESVFENVTSLKYDTKYPREYSFISLSTTLIPMSIMLAYYNDNDISVIKEILRPTRDYSIDYSKVYEIMTGYDTNAASSYLETTLTESGIAIPIVHDKYAYCHGRSSLSYYNDHSLIHFNQKTELDKIYEENLPQYYKQTISMERQYEDPIINDFYLTYQAMLLSKKIAEKNGTDLSQVEYSPVVKKIYYFKGEM